MPAPWAISNEDARTAYLVLIPLFAVLVGWLIDRYLRVGQRRDRLAYLGTELNSNANKLKNVGTPLNRSAWDREGVRGLFKWEDATQIEAAYAEGDRYNDQCARVGRASGDQGQYENKALREVAAQATPLFEEAVKIVKRYGWP